MVLKNIIKSKCVPLGELEFQNFKDDYCFRKSTLFRLKMSLVTGYLEAILGNVNTTKFTS